MSYKGHGMLETIKEFINVIRKEPYEETAFINIGLNK